jgi:hypothetical protein
MMQEALVNKGSQHMMRRIFSELGAAMSWIGAGNNVLALIISHPPGL